ncbi:hypothetical protein AVEN_54107-1 [Araneus ventricosus]|uniref:HTH psq-type domain-containing protein n=1 Tax=Araneus ventricosus TaxID=182803 RepID=A0A4Y2BUT0_ARAVE|nr:hypothetical protein AVEN_54107-1 [Araneus ventricosus]
MFASLQNLARIGFGQTAKFSKCPFFSYKFFGTGVPYQTIVVIGQTIPIQLQGVKRKVILDERRNHLNHCLFSVVPDVLIVENLFKMANCGERKHVVVSMELRLDALKRIDKSESFKSIALSFGVGESTVSDWKKKRKEIESFCSKLETKRSARIPVHSKEIEAGKIR